MSRKRREIMSMVRNWDKHVAQRLVPSKLKEQAEEEKQSVVKSGRKCVCFCCLSSRLHQFPARRENRKTQTWDFHGKFFLVLSILRCSGPFEAYSHVEYPQ